MQKRGGYGLVYQDVTRNKNISAAAKGLYAYLSAFCGVSDECYPSVETITSEMGMGKDTFYKHINALVAVGVVQKKQVTGNDGRFGRTIYKLTHEVEIKGFPYTKNRDTDISYTESKETINNNLKNNIIKNNNIDYQLIVDMYNDTCVSFPRVNKLSEKRKKAIRARLKSYTLEDFKKLFEMAEESSFLKGQNSRNWSANFDWLIMDANMVKTLDGNYTDKIKVQGKDQSEYGSPSSIKLW